MCIYRYRNDYRFFSVSFRSFSVSFRSFSVSFRSFSVSFRSFSVSFRSFSVSFKSFSVSFRSCLVSFWFYLVRKDNDFDMPFAIGMSTLVQWSWYYIGPTLECYYGDCVLKTLALHWSLVGKAALAMLACHIGTTLDQRWHDSVVNMGMPIQILWCHNSSCKLGMYRLYIRIIVFHKQVLINSNCE